MEAFRVPKRETRVRILLEDGRSLEGEIFAPWIGPDGQPGRAADRLNDPDEEFLAMHATDGRFLLNKAGIVSVQVPGSHTEVLHADAGAGRLVAVRVGLNGGTGLVGRLYVSMPPERSRVLDYLNAAPRFFPVVGEGYVTLVQKSRVVSVFDLAAEE
jgi:hypothetical protein